MINKSRKTQIVKIVRQIQKKYTQPFEVKILTNNDKVEIDSVKILLPELERITHLLEKNLDEQIKQRRMLDVARTQLSASMFCDIRELAAGGQLTLRETLQQLASSNDSFARFGDGEFRLIGHPEENLSFQRNSIELRQELIATIKSASDEGLLVGFPHIYMDTNWSLMWAEIWFQVREYFDGDAQFGDSHVTRPVAFKQLGNEATDLWKAVWHGKDVCIVTGKGSRFDLSPHLFEGIRSSTLVESTASDAFEDLPRVLEELQGIECDMVLIALGPAGTILARKLFESGVRALDIGHLSDSHANVFLKAVRPEAKPIRRNV